MLKDASSGSFPRRSFGDLREPRETSGTRDAVDFRDRLEARGSNKPGGECLYGPRAVTLPMLYTLIGGRAPLVIERVPDRSEERAGSSGHGVVSSPSAVTNFSTSPGSTPFWCRELAPSPYCAYFWAQNLLVELAHAGLVERRNGRDLARDRPLRDHALSAHR
jgi:hypothetical protein